jgi:hypothetical protein
MRDQQSNPQKPYISTTPRTFDNGLGITLRGYNYSVIDAKGEVAEVYTTLAAARHYLWSAWNLLLREDED